MATVQATPTAEPRFVIYGVTWEQYLALLDWVGDRHIRITFDGENLELMSPSYEHGRGDSLIGYLVRRLSEELDLDICSSGPTTFKSEQVKKGLEPDECFWFQNEPLIRGKTELDLNVDPPPDLAIEVEVTRSILNRLEIYAALGVPELWRWRNERVEILLLGPDGQYHPSDSSLCLPMVPNKEFSRWVARGLEMSERQLIREFVAWVRETILPNLPAGDRDEPVA